MFIVSILLLIFNTGNFLIPILNKKKEANGKQVYDAGDKLMIVFSVLALGLSVYAAIDAYYSDQSKAEREKKFQSDLDRQLKQRDSLHAINDSIQRATYFFKDSVSRKFYSDRVDSSYERSITASNEALAKYNLVLVDSLNRVTDKVNIKAVNKPLLALPAVGEIQTPIGYYSLEDGDPFFIIRLKAKKNVCYNIKLAYAIFGMRKTKQTPGYLATTFIVDKGEIFEERQSLAEDVVTTSSISLNQNVLNLQESMIYIYGSYSSDVENKDRMTFQEVLEFNFATKSNCYIRNEPSVAKALKAQLIRNNGYIQF